MLYYRAIDKCLGKMNEKRMRKRERGDGRKVPPGLLVFVNMKRRRNTYIYMYMVHQVCTEEIPDLQDNLEKCL